MQIDNLRKLFIHELEDIYDAEHQLVDALQEMSRSARSGQLKRAFDEHRSQTQGQIERLERVFRGLGEEAKRKTCEGIKGLLEEGKEVMKADGDQAAIDAALIGAAQKVEHYEIAAYGTLRTFAATLGRRDEAKLLQQTLEEESAADEKLSDIAVSAVNPEAEEGNGETAASRGRLASLLASIGIHSREPSTRGATESRTKGGSRKASKGASGGGRKTGARKTGARKTGARKTGGSKTGGSKTAAKGGATKGATKTSAAKKSGASKRSASKRSASKSGASKRSASKRSATKRSASAGKRRRS